MKAVKILAIVFGVLLLLTGGGLMAAAAVVGTGQGAIDREMGQSGLAGPVKGIVSAVDAGPPELITVDYTDRQGQQQSGSGPSATGSTPAVGDAVSLFYSTTIPARS